MNKKLYSFGLMTFLGVMHLFAVTITPLEKVSIATDRDVYIAGDRVYFSIKLQEHNHISDYVYVTVSSENQQQIFTGCMKINNNTASGSFYLTDTLTTGIYQLVSYTNDMRNFGQEAFAIKNILVANRFDFDMKKITAETVLENFIIDTLFQTRQVNHTSQQVKLNKEVFSQREPVKLDIRLPEEISKAMVSVSVRKVAPVNFPETRFNQEYTNPVNSCYYLPERSGFIVEGHINDQNHTSVAQRLVFLSSKDSIANLQYSLTNNEGEFRFFLNPYYFGKRILVRMEGEDKSTIDIKSKYFNGIIGTLPMQINGDIENYIQMDQKYLGIQRSYNLIYNQEQPEKITTKGWRSEVYSREGVIVKPSDYLYLPDFLEISRELLPYYKIREKKNDYEGTLIDINQKDFEVPFIFIDGILLEHVRQIIPLDSKKIKSILTIPNVRFLGDLNIPGILDITSTSEEIENLQWRSPVAILNVERPLSNSFYMMPEIDKMPRQIPVYLPLLYWNSALPLDSSKNSTIAFYTSDCTGTFEVVIKGFSSDGKEIEFRKLFNVTSIKL